MEIVYFWDTNRDLFPSKVSDWEQILNALHSNSVLIEVYWLLNLKSIWLKVLYGYLDDTTNNKIFITIYEWFVSERHVKENYIKKIRTLLSDLI